MRVLVQTGLIVAALAQLAIGLDGRVSVPPPPLTVGDTLSIPDIPLSKEHATVLLVFTETCAHCRRIAPQWSEWMREPRTGVAVITVSSDEEEDALRFSRQHRFSAPVVSLPPHDLQSPSGQLVSKTPWAWIIGPDRRIIYQGHGADLAAVDSVLATVGARSVE